MIPRFMGVTTFSIRIFTLSIKGLYVTVSITTHCHYAECPILFITMLNVVMLNVVMLNAVMLNVIMLNVVTLSVVGPVSGYTPVLTRQL
jgi:hypothetical protein